MTERLDLRTATLGLLAVLAANVLYLAGLPQILDPMISMEALYIDIARQPVGIILQGDPGWGPLYALWLKPWRMLLGDPVTIYTANLYALSIGITILLYLHCVLLTRRPGLAAVAALLFLISDLNVPLNNKVSAFALLILLAGLTLAELAPKGAKRTTIVALGLFVASYARPELYLAAWITGLIALGMALKAPRDEDPAAWIWPATVFVLAIAVASIIGTPVLSPNHANDRLFVAFREHFAWNWGRWNGQRPVLLEVWQREFGQTESLLGAFATNPSAFFHHLVTNLAGTLKFLVVDGFRHYPILAPTTFPSLVAAESLMEGALLVGAIVLVLTRDTRRPWLSRYGHALLPYAIIGTTSLISATVVYPLPHYLVSPSVLLLLAGILAVAEFLPTRGQRSWWYEGLVILAYLAMVPRPFELPTNYRVADSPFLGDISVRRRITDTIGFVHSLNLPTPVAVLTLTDGIGQMLGDGYREVKAWMRGTLSLEEYMRTNQIGLVITLEAGRDSFVTSEPFWSSFQIDPTSAGFTRLAVPGHDVVGIYVRNDLRKPEEPTEPSAAPMEKER